MASEHPSRRSNATGDPRNRSIASEPRSRSAADDPRYRSASNDPRRRGAVSEPLRCDAEDDGLEELRRMSHDQDWLGRRAVPAPQRKRPSRRTNPAVIALVCAVIAVALVIAVAMFLLR